MTGYLLAQNYREGDPLKKGDLMFQIDPRPFAAVLEQAKGQRIDSVEGDPPFGRIVSYSNSTQRA